MLRVAEHLLAVTLLDDRALVHHRDPVGEVLDHRQVVGDEQIGQAEPLLQIQQQVDDARPGSTRPAPTPVRRGPGSSAAVPAPARCRCAASGRRRTRPDSGWRPRGAARRGPAVRRPVRRCGSCQSRWPATVLRGRRTPAAVDPARRPGSWNTTCRSPRSARRACAVQRGDVGTEHLDRTRLRGGQLQDLVQGRRLARPGFADDAQRAALLQLEADPVDRAHLADPAAKHHALGQRVGLDQIAHPQHHRRVGRGFGGGRFGGDAVDVGGAAARDLIGADARHPMARRRPRAVPVRRRGSRRWPAGSAARTGSPAAARPATAARPGSAPAARPAARPGGAPNRAALRCRAFGDRGKVVDGCRLDRPSRVHHQRAVGELGDDPEVVGDDQHAGAGDVARGPQHVEDLRLHGDIERGGRLVADQQVGIVGDGDRDDHPLAFATGQLVRERPGPPIRLGDADQFEQFDRAGPGRPRPTSR